LYKTKRKTAKQQQHKCCVPPPFCLFYFIYFIINQLYNQKKPKKWGKDEQAGHSNTLPSSLFKVCNFSSNFSSSHSIKQSNNLFKSNFSTKKQVKILFYIYGRILFSQKISNSNLQSDFSPKH
jgi:hypothetical protein